MDNRSLTYNKKIIDQQHQKTILSNGLTILSLTREDVASVAIEVWVQVGSRYEDSSLNGIAHFIEHMNFKGTSKRNAKEIAEEFDAIGGYLNAYTSKEQTVYSAKVLKEFLPLSIDVLSDIMFNSVYDYEEIEKEKNVVLQELAQTKDNPDDLVFENFSDTIFKNQSIGRSILGSEENINNFTRDQIIDFVHKHYSYPRIIISVAGNISHDELLKLIEAKFTIPFSEDKKIEFESPTYTGGYSVEHNSDLSQLHLIVGYEGIPIISDDYYKLEMLSNILGGSISSRLFQEIREKRGLVYSVGSFCQYYSDTGVFGISANTSPEKINELLNVLSEEIQKIIHNISQEEVNRCLAQVKSSLHMSRETIDNWVSILAGNYAYYNRYISREEIWQNYAKITIEELSNFAKKLFLKEKPITITILGDISDLPNYKQLQELLTIKI